MLMGTTFIVLPLGISKCSQRRRNMWTNAPPTRMDNHRPFPIERSQIPPTFLNESGERVSTTTPRKTNAWQERSGLDSKARRTTRGLR